MVTVLAPVERSVWVVAHPLPWNTISTLGAATHAQYTYDYAGQDPINNYDLAGTDMKEEDELGATGGIYPRPSPGDAAGSGAVDEIGTEFGQTRYWQVSRLGQQYLRDGARSLEKSIRSWEGRIAEHEEKIRLAHETGLVRPVQHWEAEIKNFRSLTVAARFVLKYGALW